VAADLRLGGFRGEWGDDTWGGRRKRELLEAEGCVFDASGAIARECLHSLGPSPPKAAVEARGLGKRVRPRVRSPSKSATARRM